MTLGFRAWAGRGGGTASQMNRPTRITAILPAAGIAALLLAFPAVPGISRHPGPSRPARLADVITGAPRLAAIKWAETQTGKGYCWGGAGPSCFDCSGLVTQAYQHAGVDLPRTTYDMLRSPHLVPVPREQAQRGDLAFYGNGHVEFVTVWWHMTFGSLDTGTQIGWHRWDRWWHPTMFFRVR
jgi:cell wall-associated NlpC family hydrolase